jgi:acetyltransferase-like isoleucine patch superfamily enzyme
MLNNLLFNLLRGIRKLRNTNHQFCIGVKKFYYYYISKQRFVLKSPIIIGKRFSINSDISNTSVYIDRNCRIRNNFNVTIGNNGVLSVGENCFFNNNCSINCLGKIEIGNNNQFGESVLFYDHNHQYLHKNKLISEQGFNIGSIKIGNNCWIGSNVVILQNVIIGDNVVIGAGCVIYKSIASNTKVINQQNLVEKSL